MTHLRTRAVHVDQHPAVHYPGLPGHPQHALAQRQLQGGFGGMVSFELARNERAAAAQVLNRLALFTQAVSRRCRQPGLPPGQHHAQLCLGRGAGCQWRDRGADTPERED